MASNAPLFHRQYLGRSIYRNDQPGYKLRWTATSPTGQRLAADTLEGIKQLIRESREKNN